MNRVLRGIFPFLLATSALMGETLLPWRFTDDPGMTTLSAQAAHSGGEGLRIVDNSAEAGSSALSARVPVTPGRGYRLTLWARIALGQGLGVYVRYYAAGQDAPLSRANLDISPTPGGWKQFELESAAPPKASLAEVWVHSYAANQVSADIDDVTLESFTVENKPPWPPAYKLTPRDPRLTAADVVGPDGLVYPDWRLAGVPGGIPSVKAVIGADYFTGLRGQDVSARLVEAMRQIGAQGGAIELPAGKFFVDQPIVIRESGVVIRGAGLELTRLVFRNHIPRGEIRFYNWADTGAEVGPGGAIEIQANPKDLAGLRMEVDGQPLKEQIRSKDEKGWGNRFNLRLIGKELFAKLSAGPHVLQATATYANGDKFTRTFPLHLSPEAGPSLSPDQNGLITLVGPGRVGEEIKLALDGQRGSQTLALAAGHGLRVGDRILLEAPITERWNKLVGNRAPATHFRQYFYEITAVEGNTVTLNQPLRIEFPVIDGSFVQKTSFIQGSGIENLTIEQEITVPSSPPAGLETMRYWYPIEDLWLDGVTSAYAWGCWVHGVKVVNAGRNPLYLTRSKFCEIRDSEADDALFKGAGGTAYVGLERSFDCLLYSVTTRRMRHAPDLQWGSAGNVVRQGRFYGSDAQFHAGWTNENLLEGNLITASADDSAESNGYGYGILSTGPSDPLHGPEGPRNVAYGNDVISPKDGLRMLGGNEGWIVAYNRFRIEEGLAIFVGEKSFDHIIRDNVFVIGKSPGPAIQVDSPDATGLEFLGNAFYGPVRRLAEFRDGIGALARDEGNRILPYNEDAAAPKPPVPSIFEWQRSPSDQPKPPTGQTP